MGCWGPVVAGCKRYPTRARPLCLLCLSFPRSRRFLLGAPNGSGNEGSASTKGETGSHLPAHGRLPAAWLPHAGRDVRGLRGEERLGTWDPEWGRGPGRTALSQLSPLDPIALRLIRAPVHSASRRSSSKTNSGKSTAWLVRSSTQTWIKIIRVRGRVCLVEKLRGERGPGTVGLGGDSGVSG